MTTLYSSANVRDTWITTQDIDIAPTDSDIDLLLDAPEPLFAEPSFDIEWPALPSSTVYSSLTPGMHRRRRSIDVERLVTNILSTLALLASVFLIALVIEYPAPGGGLDFLSMAELVVSGGLFTAFVFGVTGR